MRKTPVSLKLEPELLQTLKQMANGQSLNSLIEELIQHGLATPELLAAAHEEVQTAQAALARQQQIANQLCSERDGAHAALARAQRQVQALDSERNQLRHRLASVPFPQTVALRVPAKPHIDPRIEQFARADELVRNRQCYFGIGLFMALPVWAMILLVVPSHSGFAHWAARFAIAPFGDAKTAGLKLMGDDAAAEFLFNRCPAMMTAIRITQAQLAHQRRVDPLTAGKVEANGRNCDPQKAGRRQRPASSAENC